MDNMNIKIDLTQPEKPNPIHLLTASLKYLMAYTKALTKEYDLPDDDVSATVICISPNEVPFMDFSDRINLDDLLTTNIVYEEEHTGMMMACTEADLIPDENFRYLIGPAVLFNIDEGGNYAPVTARNYQKARELYAHGQDAYDMQRNTLPAIRVRVVGDPIT